MERILPKFKPDYRYMLDVMANKKPRRLPLYEHLISPVVMEKIQHIQFAGLDQGNVSDIKEFCTQYCRFYKEMSYDTVSFEVCITDILPDNGAIFGGRPGPIQNRDDFNKYPWDELPYLYWKKAKPLFDMFEACMPDGMKAVGGAGNGVFEISEDLVGFEYLALMMLDDHELCSDLFRRIGDLMTEIWSELLRQYAGLFMICRFGDDLGFKTSTLISPAHIRQYVIPQYERVIGLVRQAGRPFLWHSCGNIFPIMEDVIALGINGKHSNEDAIAPFERWISLYGDRIGLLGGIDVDLLCLQPPDIIYKKVMELGGHLRKTAKGYALGSGNSIPDYVPVEGYLAMIRAARRLREVEKNQ